VRASQGRYVKGRPRDEMGTCSARPSIMGRYFAAVLHRQSQTRFAAFPWQGTFGDQPSHRRRTFSPVSSTKPDPLHLAPPGRQRGSGLPSLAKGRTRKDKPWSICSPCACPTAIAVAVHPDSCRLSNTGQALSHQRPSCKRRTSSRGIPGRTQTTPPRRLGSRRKPTPRPHPHGSRSMRSRRPGVSENRQRHPLGGSGLGNATFSVRIGAIAVLTKQNRT